MKYTQIFNTVHELVIDYKMALGIANPISV